MQHPFQLLLRHICIVAAGTDSSIKRVFVAGELKTGFPAEQIARDDIFLRPRHELFTDMEHSYIIELKYLKSKATDTEVARAVQEAHAQVCRYAATLNVGENIGHTTLHKVIVVYRGVDMLTCKEV